MSAPLCIDLFCGLGGWTEGLIALGFDRAFAEFMAFSTPERILGLLAEARALAVHEQDRYATTEKNQQLEPEPKQSESGPHVNADIVRSALIDLAKKYSPESAFGGEAHKTLTAWNALHFPDTHLRGNHDA